MQKEDTPTEGARGEGNDGGPPQLNSMKLVAIEGKGNGFVATEAIAKGTVLIIEPALTSPSHDALITILLSRPSSSFIAPLYFPANVAADPNLPQSLTSNPDRLQAFHQIQANAFVLHPSESSNSNLPTICLFPTISLFNHSCRPNAILEKKVFSNDQDQNTEDDSNDKQEQNIEGGEEEVEGRVVAIEDIPQGTEICLSYLGAKYLYRPTLERRNKIKENPDWNFECICDRCKKNDVGEEIILRLLKKPNNKRDRDAFQIKESQFMAKKKEYEIMEQDNQEGSEEWEIKFELLKKIKTLGEELYVKTHWLNYWVRGELIPFQIGDWEECEKEGKPGGERKAKIIVKELLEQIGCEGKILPECHNERRRAVHKYMEMLGALGRGGEKWAKALPEYKEINWGPFVEMEALFTQ